MSYKLTIDRDLMDLSPPIKGMTILKRWKNEGRIELFEAEPPLERRQTSILPTVAWTPTAFRNRTKIFSKSASGKTTSAKLAPVIFPLRDRSRLNMTEVNDVAHLALHSQSGNELFVTQNTNFINDGKRERLASVGVITMTPDEAVSSLAKIEGWK